MIQPSVAILSLAIKLREHLVVHIRNIGKEQLLTGGMNLDIVQRVELATEEVI